MKYKLQFFYCIAIVFLAQNCTERGKGSSEYQDNGAPYYSLKDFETVKKFDTHIHFNYVDTCFIQQAEADGFYLVNITDDRPFGLPLKEQKIIAEQIEESFSSRITYATTFSTQNWEEEQWVDGAIAELDSAFSKGAKAVKVWKNIGMELKDRDGKFVMVDHPKLDRIWQYLAEKNIPVIGHNGEPKDCWLPLEEMTINGTRNYYSNHPEYHMYLHPEYPSYEDQIQARDNVLERNPDLTFIGAHLGSLEWSLDELSKRLDKYPNMAVDLSRMSNLQNHAMMDSQKTYEFFLKYQDRLLYGSDKIVGEPKNPSEMKKNLHNSWLSDWKFLATDDTMTSSGFEGEFKGLKLPKEVIDKIYFKNAKKWILGLDPEATI
ncbi:MAG TPA: amidohydrolase family protein [Lunatimonas sp.]|nr:amidohydrolase family protein [Lunatimonas sp.]